MRPYPALLSLLCLGLGACTPRDGWPHLEDHLWRIVLDPAGAHSFTASEGAAAVAVLRKGDPVDVEALVAGYRGTERSAHQPTQPAWRHCEDPTLPRGTKLAQPSSGPDNPGVAWLGPATQVEIPRPPGNRTEVLRQARTALEGLTGGEATEPATVRTLIKQRRPGAPPVLLAVGDAGCTGLVAVLDEDARPLVSDAPVLPGPRCAPLAAIPPADIDGDGIRELVVRAGNGEPGVGTYRAVYHIELDGDAPRLDRVWHASFLATCPEG
jgi:hypothetical protein